MNDVDEKVSDEESFAYRYVVVRLAALEAVRTRHDPKRHEEALDRLAAATTVTQAAHVPAWFRRDAIDALLSWLVAERGAVERLLNPEGPCTTK